MTGWWVTRLLEDSPVLLVSWIVWVIVSITLHELAHGWTAIWCGDRTPIETGHMTWNPLVHMGTASIIMFVLIGIAFGLMPVNPSRFRGRYDDALVSFAGPAMNLALTAVCIIALIGWLLLFRGGVVSDPLATNVVIFLHLGASLNIGLALLNLMPLPPLDGSRILATFDSRYARLIQHPNAPTVGLIGFVLVLIFGGRQLWSFTHGTVTTVTEAVMSLL